MDIKSIQPIDKCFPLFKMLIYYFRLYKFKIKNICKGRYYRYVYPYKFWIFTFLYYLLVIYVSNHVVNNYAVNIFKNDSVTFFTSVGAMLGAVLAIVFTLSNLQIQNAAQQSSAGFYEILGRDHVRDLSLLAIAFLSLSFFILAIISSTPNAFDSKTLELIGWLSIVVLGFVFWILYALYKRTFDRISPQTNLKLIRDDAFKLLNKIIKAASEMTRIAMSQPALPEGATEEIATAASFQRLTTWLNAYNAHFDHLYDYHDKLYAHQEKRMARRVLTIVSEILCQYFRLRSKSSIIIPGNELQFVGISDSHDYLTPNLEQLVSKGQMYIMQNDNAGITHVINIFFNLAIIASGIQYASSRSSDNPIFGQCRGYYDQLMQSAIGKSNMEAMFQGAKAYALIGHVAIRAKLQREPASIYKKLDEIGIHAMTTGMSIVWGEVLKAYAFIFSKLMVSEMPGMKVQIKMLLEHMREMILLGAKIISQCTVDSIFTLQSNIITPLQEVEQTLFNIARSVSKEDSTMLQEDLRRKYLIGVEELRLGLYYLSEEIKDADHPLVSSLAIITSNIGCLLFGLLEDERWQDNRQALIEQARWYLHQPEWFFQYAGGAKGGGSFDELVESITKMGLCALKVNQDNLAKDAIDVLSRLANEMLTKERGTRYGFTEPRIMERACFIGILAIRQGKKEIVDKLKERIMEFEDAYKQQWFSDVPEGVEVTSPRPKQLQIEVLRLRDTVRDRGRNRRLLDSSEDRLVEDVEIIDVDRFTYNIWRSCQAGSPLEQELKKNKKEDEKA